MNSYILLFILAFPAVSSLAVYFSGKRSKRAADIILTTALLIEFGVICACFRMLQKSDMNIQLPHVMGYGLHMKLDMLRYIFVCMSGFIWMIAGMYSTWHIDADGRAHRFHACFMVTLSAVVGVFISENLLNLFTFFEVMALVSYVLVIHKESDGAHEAGKLYFMVSIASGMASLMGIFILYEHTGELQIGKLAEMGSQMGNIKYAAAILMSMGFAAKACMFPLHIWLSKTYSHSPAPATVVLSGVMAKTGVYGIMVISFIVNWDEKFSIFLLIVSTASMLIGGLLAILNTEIKKILAYSSMSHMGYMVLAVALAGLTHHNPQTAISASVYHVVNHALCKSLLFMAAGVIMLDTKSEDINSIHKSPIKGSLKMFWAVGLLSNIGFPGFNGFTSKTLIHHGIAELDIGFWKYAIESVFFISSSFAVAYSLKLYSAIFSSPICKSEGKGSPVGYNLYIPLFMTLLPMAYISAAPDFVNQLIQQGSAGMFAESAIIGFEFYKLDYLKASVQVVVMGFFVYKIFELKGCVKRKGGILVYTDILEDWSKNMNWVFAIAYRFTFKAFNAAFGFIDGFMEKIIQGAFGWFKRVCKMQMKNESLKKGENKYYEISEISRMILIRMESITYSVFVTAVIFIAAVSALLIK
ncbi:Formate hydrogenlyase subunit 3/Multisubunit Na+/H+ antiporter, MnhD subunit [Peptoclostridium litorale DSM 5388]|uniref:Hydrogenase-4 component B n=1 Tax=Peptoclostridium litorale DSM 5388 TaxID=1121324 RepID=A0A069RK17_PEPLI|nr:proton-conducting transporter membrane subunit [Peptoclostridium litorale]KDR94567.1 hydrogenase-4 component B [Peptoclostridium litorale DSM 5388]SIO31493.1 Formate hydrogenlyase subunit 3/Multisubunit Na+/H+ antiporter, MnhD subunit [Peptoclostridium litorale DSM 5388]